MIAVGESGEKVVLLAQEGDGALLRLEMSDEQAEAMMAQLAVLLEARAVRRGGGTVIPLRRATAGIGDADPAEEARERDEAEIARREREAKQDAAREARRARGQGGTI